MSDTPKIMPVEPCGFVGKCMSHPSSYTNSMTYGSNSPTAVANRATQELGAARAKDLATHERNLPAIENNKVVAERVEALMLEIGMPKSWSERDTKSRSRYPKLVSHEAGWIGDVRRNCKTDDGFALATSIYERLLKDYQAYAERAKAEAATASEKAQRERDAELAKRKANMELASILLRYELPIESDWSDVVEHLCSKEQRLNLAVAMQQTRCDWSEGPDRVSNALDHFKIETTEDKDIAADIVSCLRDFEDGRVFRDTTWGYDALFASIADQQLVADCQKALEHSGRES